jgi:hypothetical protein
VPGKPAAADGQLGTARAARSCGCLSVCLGLADDARRAGGWAGSGVLSWCLCGLVLVCNQWVGCSRGWSGASARSWRLLLGEAGMGKSVLADWATA